MKPAVYVMCDIRGTKAGWLVCSVYAFCGQHGNLLLECFVFQSNEVQVEK